MNFGGRFNKVKQQADRLFLRGDKTDVIGELREAEELADDLRLLTEAFSKAEEKLLNTHHVLDEKKHRKIPENQAAEILKDALKESLQSGEERPKGLYRTVTEEVAGAEQLLGKIVLDYEEQVGIQVLDPLNKLLKDDFPSVTKQKKALKQAGLEVDAARARLRNSQSNTGPINKLELHKEELDEAESKLELIRDSYAAELFTVLGKQREIAHLSCLSLEMKLEFLQKSTTQLSAVLPPIRKKLMESSCSAVFGVSLHDHLRITGQDIARPIQICVRHIIETGIREEGIFRVAGSAGKIKRFKGAFDAGLVTSEMLSAGEYSREYDIHVVSGALKCYLRELPEPLLTHIYHDQWIEAVRKTDHEEKLRSLWQVVNSLPIQNLNNLKYIIKFLALLASFSSDNKMTPNNIAIVMAPNLIWAQRVSEIEDIIAIGRNMSLGNDYRTIVEQLIEYSDYFFKGEINFGVSPKKLELTPSSPKIDPSKNNGNSNVTANASMQSGHRRTASADFNVVTGPSENSVVSSGDCESPKQVHRLRKKPAPQPPQKGSALSSSGDDISFDHALSNSHDSSRSKSPNLFQDGHSAPSPAPRLHHTNSIRRPTAEPPKPPATIVTSLAKPPRPSPPTFSNADVPSETKSTSCNVIGFEKMQKSLDDSTEKLELIDTDDNVQSRLSHNLSPENQTREGPGPIGFLVDNYQHSSNKVSKPAKDVESAHHKDDKQNEKNGEIFRDKGIVPGSFRKSLEGVLRQQPQTLPRHMVKACTSGDLIMDKKDHDKGFQLPAFPVPTQRTTKDFTSTEKPEPMPRSDKPAVPEKPSIANRSIISVDHSRPIIPERPATFSNRTNSFTKKNESNKIVQESQAPQLPAENFSTAESPVKVSKEAKFTPPSLDGSKVALCVVEKDGVVSQMIALDSDKPPLTPAKPEKPSVIHRLSDSFKDIEVLNSDKNNDSEDTKQPTTKSRSKTPSDSTNL